MQPSLAKKLFSQTNLQLKNGSSKSKKNASPKSKNGSSKSKKSFSNRFRSFAKKTKSKLNFKSRKSRK